MKFKDLKTGGYFFFPGSTVPHHKVSYGHSVECGSAYNRPTEDNLRVTPIYINEMGIIKIGNYSLPPELFCLPTYDFTERAKKASEYEDERLAFEKGQKKPSGA